MAEPKAFTPAKLIVGIIAGAPEVFAQTEEALVARYGAVDLRSPLFAFDLTDYYDGEMGKDLKRLFLSFEHLVPPDGLAAVKVRTNELENEIGRERPGAGRAVNIDPGILRGSALIMATAKDFSHRVPLGRGIYAHLEFLFGKNGVRCLDWTYPDFRQKGYQDFFLEVRRHYLEQLRRG